MYSVTFLRLNKETPMVVLFTLCADDDYELGDVIAGDVDDDDGD